MVLHLDALTYLDERPVFPEERRVVQAWGTGGDEAEADERAAIREEKKEHLNSCVRVLTEKMEANRETRDRLTKQWEEKRQNEMDILTERRRQFRDEVDNIVRLESMGRTALEKEEQNVMWDLEEVQDRERKSVQASSTEEKKECPVSPKETLLVEELLENSSPSEENDTAQLLGELQKSDEEILREMEEEIQQVLEGISSRERHTDPMHFDRVTNKSERKVHEAVGVTAERFRRNSDRSGKEELWKSFDAWDRRGSK
ncbi:hypothetical protein AGDE_14735 [Angomonas deanei]|uniref:Uncharacterized protein n=1 Tax=Angomonas deanei TaxID=59799 RepID=A0A7G2CCC3_9TRYP|nr:hypothetical protein AGDE_14735 [Angomonas deanei]CAD2216373.1 hypothetical protein, conserved [Angomonas deanei]|eukprot:EPY20326.1 hypothetical protein AGDE_14735 [Angomonas deanei]